MSLPAQVEVLPAPAAEPAFGNPLTLEESDASNRYVTLFFFAGALKWFVFSLLLGLVAAVKLHAPGLLSDVAFLSYGRVQPAYWNAFIYGFASQAGLGIALWMLCRLGRTALVQPGLVFVGGYFWNISTIIGVLALLFGQNSGHEHFEMPRYAMAMLFVSFLLIATPLVLTFHYRREREVYVSVWFILAALFWFAWSLSTAGYLLSFRAVQPPVQVVISRWFGNSLLAMWLAPLALASVFYFIPKLRGNPLYSYGTAVVAFWMYLLLAGWGGLQYTAALPRWLIAVSALAAVLLTVPAVSMALNWFMTTGGEWRPAVPTPAWNFVLAGGISFLLYTALAALFAIEPLNSLVNFTFFLPGLDVLFLYGFIGLTMLGAIYYIASQLIPGPDTLAPKAGSHYWLCVVGTGLVVVALAAAGLKQGYQFNQTEIGYPQIVRGLIPLIGLSTLGLLLLLAAQTMFFVRFGLALRACRPAGCCNFREWLAPLPAREALLRSPEPAQARAGQKGGGKR